jgi:ABC-type dipeptide/oligopeptide/nickel transport system ATPase component
MTHTQDTSPLLEVVDLSVTFKTAGREIEILNKVSFILGSHKTLGIVGESGSGKTVTALSILNLIPTPPLLRLTGEIRFLGKNLLRYSPSQLQKIRGNRISFIFQEPATALNPVLTIGDQITEMILAHTDLSKRKAKERAIGLLSEVGIPNPSLRMRNYPHEISGGMRQRAMIAMALSCEPDILIADEPTTALDVTIQAQVLELFKGLIEGRGMSVIFMTHDLGVIAEIADDVLVLQHGRVVEKDSIEQVYQHPSHPYTKELLTLLSGGTT